MAQLNANLKDHIIEQVGPYGSQLPENYSFQILEDERIVEVIVMHGGVVDSITYVVQRPDKSTYRFKTGGDDGNESSFKLVSGEYITRITGSSGKYSPANDNVVYVGQIKIYTNLNPVGYGPYGKGATQPVEAFQSPSLTDGPVIGTFGREGRYLESIGLFIRSAIN